MVKVVKVVNYDIVLLKDKLKETVRYEHDQK